MQNWQTLESFYPKLFCLRLHANLLYVYIIATLPSIIARDTLFVVIALLECAQDE